ncbi:MAG: CPBP family intramembrane glutamic endopeptidase [Clostridiaceae bacterium]
MDTSYKKRGFNIIFIVLLACILMAMVELLLTPGYLIKSIYKVVLFLLLPLFYRIITKEGSIKDLFMIDKNSFLRALLMGIGMYIFILGAYLLLGGYFDLSSVTSTLEKSVGVNKDNFLFISLYISFVNSFLEEFFFRGFAFMRLKNYLGNSNAYSFSAAAFSIYHVAIIVDWFSPLLFILLIVALFIGGLIFNYICDRFNGVFPSWMLHMFANFAVNTIGFILFYN